jgi:hypothetical protein
VTESLAPLAAGEIPSFDELVDLLRERLGYADAINSSELHSFRELMADRADVISDNWYWEGVRRTRGPGPSQPVIPQTQRR